MRLLVVSLVLANAALMGATDPASAQSPTTYVLLLHEQRAMLADDVRSRRFLRPKPYYRQSPPQSFDAPALCQQQAQASASAPESRDAYFDQCVIASGHRPQ